jgi:hypothetical protein
VTLTEVDESSRASAAGPRSGSSPASGRPGDARRSRPRHHAAHRPGVPSGTSLACSINA